MKTTISRILACSLLGVSFCGAQTTTFTNFIRQVQYPVGVAWDATVAASGEQLSELAIDPGG